MLELLNGGPKCTIIERMDGTVQVIGPLMNDHSSRYKIEFENLDACKKALTKEGWEPNVAFVRKTIRTEE